MADAVTPIVLPFDAWGRPIAWMSSWSWYGGKASGCGFYATSAEAIKDAIWHAMGDIKEWTTFPSRGSYPYEDRDGNEVPVLTPLFRATWDSEGGGHAEVTQIAIQPTFQAANVEVVNDIFQLIQSHKK